MNSSGEPPVVLDAPLQADVVLENADIAVLVTDRYSNIAYWNAFAERMFGFSRAEVLGRSVLELGVAEEDRYQAWRLARHVLKGGTWEGTFSNLRKDGSRLFTRIHAVPRRDPAGGGIVGMLILAREALREGKERKEDRLGLLSKLGDLLSASLGFSVTLSRVAEVLVPQFADHCFVDLFDNEGELRRFVSRHSGGFEPPTDTWEPVGEPVHYPQNHFCQLALGTEDAILIEDIETSGFVDPEGPTAQMCRDLGVRSAIAAPLVARGVLHGVLSLITSDLGNREDPYYNGDDQALVWAVASRIALAIDNALLFEEERQTALAFQKGLLPEEIPEPDGLELSHIYEPAKPLVDQGVQTQVGGDWYDVIPLSAGRVGIVIGDVEGRGARAAAIMGQLKAAVRAFAQFDVPPFELVRKLEGWVRSFGRDPVYWMPDDPKPMIPFVTCQYMVYDAWSRQLSVCNAGHAPPLLIDGDVRELPIEPGKPLGLEADDVFYKEQTFELAPGATLMMYTDGLVERRPKDFDGDAMEVLRKRLTEVAYEHPDRIVDVAVDSVPGEIDDDVAMLVIRARPEGLDVVEETFRGDPVMVPEARRMAADAFKRWRVSDEQVDLACLLVSEVVTNAVRHATVTPGPRPQDEFLDVAALLADEDADPLESAVALGAPAAPAPAREFTLRLRKGNSAVWVEVFDQDLRLPRLRKAKPSDESGRGLYLVEKLSHRWGSRATGEGKWVWFELRLQDTP
ncbi:MAG: SpoIIE family protein phosphatase [Streptosporangiaceae bacterium]